MLATNARTMDKAAEMGGGQVSQFFLVQQSRLEMMHEIVVGLDKEHNFEARMAMLLKIVQMDLLRIFGLQIPSSSSISPDQDFAHSIHAAGQSTRSNHSRKREYIPTISLP
jgi:hypothetical protein